MLRFACFRKWLVTSFLNVSVDFCLDILDSGREFQSLIVRGMNEYILSQSSFVEMPGDEGVVFVARSAVGDPLSVEICGLVWLDRICLLMARGSSLR